MKTFTILYFVLALLIPDISDGQWLNCPSPYNANCVERYYSTYQLLRIGLPQSRYEQRDTVIIQVYASDTNVETGPMTRSGDNRLLPDSAWHVFNFVIRNSLGSTFFNYEASTPLVSRPWADTIYVFGWLPETRLLKLIGLLPGNYTITAYARANQIYDQWVSTALTIDATTSVPAEALPAIIRLEQNYPNPFNPVTTIGFSTTTAGPVRLTVVNLLGQIMVKLLNEQVPAGSYSLLYNAYNLPSGTYFYRLEAGKHAATKKMVILR